MNINEFNLFLSIIWILIIYFVFGFENTFKSLVFSEFLWITLFLFYLINALIYDDINILSFTLFFLILSAIEISIGLTIIILQKKLFKTLHTSFSSKKNIINKKIRYLNSFKFKY